MSRIFHSHNHSDKPFARMLAADIKASGSKIWRDEVGLKVGGSLILKTTKAIGEAAHVIAFLSTNSVRSNWVKKGLATTTTLDVNGNRVTVLPLLRAEIS